MTRPLVTQVTSNKPGVIKPSFKKNKGIYYVTLPAKKAGSSKDIVTYKARGKTYKAAATYKAVAFPNKSLKLNGKDQNLKKNIWAPSFSKYKKAKTTIKVTLAKGWTLESIEYYQNGKPKKLKSGTAIKMAKNTVTGVYINLKKGKQHFSYYLSFDRCY